MRYLFLVLLFAVISGYAQIPDTVSGSQINPATYSTFGKSADFARWEVSDGNHVTYKSTQLKNSVLVERIITLESQEYAALKNRDSLQLMLLWSRDFTLDETQALVSNKGGIPYYIAFDRMVEEINPIDSITVITTGTENQQQIGLYHSDQGEKKKFFHIWTKINGVWKLTTRRYQK